MTPTPIEISCPNCGNRYRLPVPHDNAHHFHCVDCDTCFNTQPTNVAADNLQPNPASPSAAMPISEDQVALHRITKKEAPAETAIIPEQETPPCASTTFSPPPPLAAPSVRLWPWLTALLLIIAAIGGWVNLQAWSHTPLLQSIQAWWAPQRSIGWKITQTRPQWINRQDATPLLAIGLQLHNDILFDRAPPPLLLTTHSRNSHLPAESQLVMLHQQPSLTQLEQPSWQPPEEDRTPIAAGGERNYTVVLDQPPNLLESVELTLN